MKYENRRPVGIAIQTLETVYRHLEMYAIYTSSVVYRIFIIAIDTMMKPQAAPQTSSRSLGCQFVHGE